jgi:HK97 family phage major capsid protein
MDAISSKLIQERQGLVHRAEGVKQTAYEDNQRDLVDSERATLGNIQQRIASIDEQLALTTTDYALNAETAARIAQYAGAAVIPQEGYQYRTAGEVLFDVLHQGSDREARERFQSVMRAQTRAAEHMGTSAGVTVPTAGGMPGLVVRPIQGPVIDLAWRGMPMFQALNPQPATNPLGWSRPRIVDPYLDTAAGPQAGSLEKAELPSKHFEVKADNVDLTTLGNYLNVSIQLESFIAGSLDIIITQLNKRLSRGLEHAAVAELAKATKKITLAANATADLVLKAIYDGAAAVFTATQALPTWLAMGPLGWARMGGVSDLAGRPLFPTLNPTNAPGTSSASAMGSDIAGIRTVITPGITDTTMYMGNGEGIEAAVYRFPMLQAIEPSVLGRQVAVAASYGFYRPPTTEAGPSDTPPAKYEAVVVIAP